MNILGINTGHNATAALILNNKLQAAISEEKFTNIKNYYGFPLNAINFLMKNYNLSADNIDHVAVVGYINQTFLPTEERIKKMKNQKSGDFNVGFFYATISQLIGTYFNFSNEIFYNFYSFYQEKIKRSKNQKALIELLNKLYGFRKSQIVFVHHHLCHTYAPIGFFNLHKEKEPILVITQDGQGDLLCGMTGIYENGNYKQLDSTPAINSFASIYAAVTSYLGMKVLEHEHKVMGLAAYPPKEYGMKVYEKKFKDLAEVKDGKILLKYKTFLTSEYARFILKDLLFRERFDNIAFGVQYLIEEKMTEFVRQNIEKYKIKNLAFSGGLFMNVKLNKKIQEMPEVEKCYFMPSCGDETNAIGAAFYVLEHQGEVGISDQTMYLGKEYTDEEIEQYFKENDLDKKYELEKHKNIEKFVAELIAQGEVVGRFEGRGEVGARSLGNRAILANPSKLESVEIINHAIKSRDFWMPFAPSVLDYRFEDYALFNHKSLPYYMITAFDSTNNAKQELKAALHRKDHTLRPNVVKKEHNEKYFKLIEEYQKLTGTGGVLNTSLNLHGYPLVGFLKELFFTMDNSDLNIVKCGNYLIKKKR